MLLAHHHAVSRHPVHAQDYPAALFFAEHLARGNPMCFGHESLQVINQHPNLFAVQRRRISRHGRPVQAGCDCQVNVASLRAALQRPPGEVACRKGPTRVVCEVCTGNTLAIAALAVSLGAVRVSIEMATLGNEFLASRRFGGDGNMGL